MEKQTKNIITRQWVKKELLFYNTATLKHTAVGLAAVILLLGFISFLLSAFSREGAIVVGLLGGIPLIAILVLQIRLFKERKQLQNGAFEIVTRPLLYKDEKMVGSGRNRRLQEMLHFDGFDEVWANHTEYQLCTMDDEFYIVHYKGSKKAEMVFPLKLYEYKENNK